MEEISVSDVLAAVGGRLLCGSKDLPLSHVRTDSRKVEPGDLYVPIPGEHVDGHRFIPQAIRSGAACVLTSEHDDAAAFQRAEIKNACAAANESVAVIRVADTKKALQAFGACCRNRLSIPVIGITGSVGKTTTRELTAAALSAALRAYRTPGNANSQVGVPITLSEITGADEAAVLELGMSLPGEMSAIARIARVDIAVITNIGVAHIAQLGSREAILREKLKIQDGMAPGGTLILNGDDALLKNVRAEGGIRTVFYGTGRKADYRAEDIRLTAGGTDFTAVCAGRRLPVRLLVPGRHNVLNALAALAAADAVGVDAAAAAAGLSAFTGFAGRQNICRLKNLTVIDDAYNASPDSMRAGLSVLAELSAAKAAGGSARGRRVAVLADMKELGADAVRYHRELGAWMKNAPVDLLFTLGAAAGEIREAAIRAGAVPEAAGHSFAEGQEETLFEALLEDLCPGDTVLIKGSNSMRLSKVAARLLAADKEGQGGWNRT